MDEEAEAARLIDKKNEKIEEGLQRLRECRHGRVGAIWKICQKLKGSKSRMEAVTVKDADTRHLLVSSEEIKKVS